jgi:ribosomal protein S18 acetylase RimI-like enzyme
MPVTVRDANRADLLTLAGDLAALALFIRYGRSANALLTQLTQALVQPTDNLRVASVGSHLSPVGLSWFLPTGTFAGGAYLRLLAVLPAAQSQGVGQALLQDFESLCAPRSASLFLLCSDFNTDAQRFYRRHGYAQVGMIPDFAAPTINEVIFYKKRRVP